MKYSSLQRKVNQDIANTLNKLNAANGIDSRISARDVAAVAAAYAVTSTEPSTASPTTVKENTESAKKTYSLQPIGIRAAYDDTWKKGWFKKGEGNFFQNTGATIGDALTDLTTGIVNIPELLTDAFVTLASLNSEQQLLKSANSQAMANSVLGKSENNEGLYEEAIKQGQKTKEVGAEFVKKDLYDADKVTKKAINAPVKLFGGDINWDRMEANSVFDYKTDSLMQSSGQLVATAGMQAVGVPFWVTTGLMSFGGESENALQRGATLEEATLSGLITAAGEVLTEKISGGIKFGGKALDDVLTDALAKNISDKFARTALRLGLDMAGEGFEEVLSQDISTFGQWLTYQDEESLKELLWSEEAMDAKIEAFLGGAALGGTSGSFKTVKSNLADLKSGTQAAKDGSANSILEKAKQITEAENKNNTGYATFKNVKTAYEQLSQSLEKTNGEISTIRQKALLGELKQETTRAQLMPYIERSAEKIVQNAELVAKKYSEFGFKDANGKPITVTPEAILSGIDVNADRATYIKQLRNALTTNSVLSTLAVIDATGHIKMNTAKFAEATLKGENLADQSDLEYFVEYATETEKATVGKALGIQDWNTISIDQFRNKVADFALRGKAQSQAKIDSIPTINPEKNASFASESANINAESANLGAEAQNISQNVAKPLDNEAGVRYAKSSASRTKKYISHSKIGEENVGYIRKQLLKLYSGLDNCIGNGIAIEKDDTIYIVDSSKHNNKMDGDVAVREVIIIPDSKLRAEHIRSINNDAISNGYVSDELSSRLGIERDNNSESIGQFEVGEKLSADKGQSENNEGRVSSDNGNRGVQVLTSDKKALPSASSEKKSTQKKSETDTGKSMTVIESAAFAKENVPEYADLNADDQARVRRLIRQAKASGFTDAQTRAYARVSARSGIDIVFDKERLYRGNGEYADGLYSLEQNKIFVNPEGSRSPARLLIHELTHALYNDRQSRVILDRGAKNLTEDQKKKIWNRYFPDAEYNENNIIFKDELSSRYTEALLDDDALLEKLCNDNPTLPDKILSFFKKAITGYSDEPNLSREAKKLYKRYKTLFDRFSERNQYGSPEEARMSGKVDDSRFSLQYAPDIAENQREYLQSHKKATITEDELEMAINQTADLVSLMSPFKDILPKDIRGKTLVKNGSYDISVENTTICIRTLSYNSFTDKVAEKIGRPLTQMESFLVSQKLYEIAKEPQCLYCYVSLDRKAYNEMLLRYINERDSAVENYKKAGMPDVSSISVDKINSAKEKGTTDKLDEASKLFLNFLGDRKVTKNMLERYKSWMSIAKQGGKFLSTKAVATEAQRKALIEGKDSPLKEQAKDMFKYAQSASWAKKQTDYVAYYNDILKLSDAVVKNLNKHYGLRWYSFSDYSAAFIVENMQQITDAAIRGLKGLAYTKDTDFVKIFAPTGMNINVSVYATKDANGNYYIDEKQSANLKEAIALREKYDNVGIVVVATDNAGVEWALSQKWSDVVIPFHTVRTGADVAAFYDWTVFNNEQSDTIGDENLWNAYVESVTNGDANKSKKVSKMVYPSEHQNNREEYLRICKERGIKPRFSSFLDNPNYMKLVNETRQSESATQPLQAKFDTQEAKKSFKKFEEKGGYFEGWYNDGIDVDGEAEIVAKDIAKGLKPDEVEYSVKGFDAKKAMEKRKTNRQHGDRMALPDTESDTVDTSDSVGKKRQEYKASFKERIFTAADSVYIDTVDELYGVTKYLTKVGKIKDATSAVQAARASLSAAQTMVGDVQYDIFSDDGKKLGEGLSKIIKPITVKGEKITNSFNEYLLHWLNTDRMTLNKRSIAKQEARLEEIKNNTSELEKLVKKINKLNKKIKALGRSKSDMEVKRKLREDVKKLKDKAKTLKKANTELKNEADSFVPLDNKPVFGANETRLNDITAEESRKRIAELEKVHPDFREIAEKVWAYTKNLNHMRVEAGLISADSESYMNELYPHYVPSNRDLSYSGVGAIKGKRNLEISSTVKRAKGGGEDVLDVFDSIALQTQELLRAGRINQLFRKIYDVAVESGDNTYVEVISKEKVSRADSASMQADSIEIRPKGNQITGFIDGEKVTLKVTDEIFTAFDNMSKPTVDPTSALGKGAQRLNDIYKKLLTSYSPAFLIRNPIRDIQDAGLNSKHSILFAKNLKKAVETMLKNGEAWQIYRAYGGYSASIFGPEGFSANVDSRGFEAMAKLFDSDEVTIKTVYEAAKRSGKNLLTGINNLNAFVEQATRFAEYLASVEAGDSIPAAINNAAEVTTNFGRRGRLTKKLNATIMPFLNPSIQGFDKIFRNVTDAFKEGTPTATAKALANLLGKAAVIGLAPMLVNMLLYGDDDDYEKLREADKENNFLIKVGDTFIKIPRGRLASVIGGTANRGSKLIKGEDADLKDYAKNVINQVTPVGNLTRTIISPFFDLMNNRTWYGGEIEGRQFDNTAPKDRYDESTSSWAIAIGKVINYSPKKIHYLLDQYSGVIGDFVLPATSKKASKDFFSGNFTIDPATSNKLSTSFYKIYDKAQYAKTAGDDTAIYQVKYLNKVKDAISDMYDKKSEIQNNSELSKVEKLQQSRVVQILINQAYETALADIDRYTQAFEATQGIENTATFQSAFGKETTEATVQKMRYTEATRYMYGAKKALEEYDDAVYAKCELLNLAGIDYDKLYYYYFSTKGLTSDTDKKGNVISGSKKKKVIAAVNALGVSREQRLLLIASKGYSLTDSEKKRLLSYILKLKTTKEKRIELAELCGFTVRNGKIVADFK